MEARQRLIKDWMSKIRTRQILLPRFQRYFVWNPSFAVDFFTSILRDLPVGSALVLGVGGDELPFISRPVIGAPAEGDKVNELLLDGQQRLTALWRSLNDLYYAHTFLVDVSDKGKPEAIKVTRWEKNGKRYPLWVDNPKECWKWNLIPIGLLNPDDETSYTEWATKASGGDMAVTLEIEHTITPLRSQLASFNIPFLYLPVETPKDVAIEVFIKLNTTYVSLTAFDIIVAQLEAATGEPLHDMVDSLKYKIPKLSNYADLRNLILSVSALFQEKPPSQSGYLNIDVKRFMEDWPRLVEGAQECVDFLGEERVFDAERLPIEGILAPLIALWSEVSTNPDDKGNARILFRKYLWRAFFTERYDRAVPTAVLQDYRALKKVLRKEGSENDMPCFDEARYPLASNEELMRSRWPKYKDRLARAILLLSVRGDAEDIKDGAHVSEDNIKLRHYHHVYPRAWVQANAPDLNPDRALNCILINMRTNSAISAKEPIKYLLEASEASELGEEEIKKRLATHYVSYDSMVKGDYGGFLEERAATCSEAMRALCDGKTWKPGVIKEGGE